MARRWAAQVAPSSRRARAERGRAGARVHRRHARLRFSGSRGARTAAMAASCSPMAAARRSSRPPRWRARPISRSANSRARRRPAASCWRRRSPKARSRRSSPITSKPGRDQLRSRGTGAARPPQEDAACDHAVGGAADAHAVRGHRAHLCRRADRRRARQAAVVESRQAMARPRDVPAQGGRRELAGSVRRWAAARPRGLAGARALRQDLAEGLSAGDLSEALQALLPWDLRARLEREAPTHFEAPTGTMLAIDYEAEQGPTIAVRLQELFGLNTHPRSPGARCRWCWNCCRRRSGRCR